MHARTNEIFHEIESAWMTLENIAEKVSCNMLEDTTLHQILDVLNLIKGEAPETRYDLIDASNRAFITSTRFYGVHRNTIADACTRRLQINIGEFRELVRNWLNGDPSGLKSILKIHNLEQHHAEINAFFSAERRLP